MYVAISMNVLLYVLVQISVLYEVPLRDLGDVATGFLFRILTASFASTLSFGLYFVFIFGLYFLVKLYEGTRKKKSKLRSKVSSGSTKELLLGKNANPVLYAAQFLWFLFIMMSLFHLIGLGQGLIVAIEPCDPTKALC